MSDEEHVRVLSKIHGTYPSVIHNNGHRKSSESVNKFFAHIKEEVCSRKYEITPCDNMDVVTWSTFGVKGALQESAEAFGVTPIVMTDFPQPFSLYDKISNTLKAAEQSKKKYLLCCDAMDCVLLNNPETVLQKWKKQFGVVLFGAETKHYPQNSPCEVFEKFIYSGRYCHLNGGCFIGATQHIRRFCDKALRFLDRADEDQSIWKLMHWKYYPAIQIDFQCIIFQNMQHAGDVSDILVQE